MGWTLHRWAKSLPLHRLKIAGHVCHWAVWGGGWCLIILHWYYWAYIPHFIISELSCLCFRLPCTLIISWNPICMQLAMDIANCPTAHALHPGGQTLWGKIQGTFTVLVLPPGNLLFSWSTCSFILNNHSFKHSSLSSNHISPSLSLHNRHYNL